MSKNNYLLLLIASLWGLQIFIYNQPKINILTSTEEVDCAYKVFKNAEYLTDHT